MAIQAAVVERGVSPVHGNIYRTRNDESLMVLSVRKDRIFVEYADGRHGHLTWREWDNLRPCPSPC